MLARVLHRYPPPGIPFQQPRDQVARLVAHAPPLVLVEDHVRVGHGVESRRDVEGRAAAQEYEEYDAHGPAVDLLAVPSLAVDGRAAPEDLGGEVLGRAAEGLESLGRHVLGEAEVGELDVDVRPAVYHQYVLLLCCEMFAVVNVEGEVGEVKNAQSKRTPRKSNRTSSSQKTTHRLEVAVDDPPLLVEVVDGAQHPSHEPPRLDLRVPLPLDDAVEEVAAAHVLHDEVYGPVGRDEHVVHFDDVGVVERPEDRGLGLDGREPVGAVIALRGRNKETKRKR